MFLLHAEKVRLKAIHMEPITSGSINIYSVKFEFSSDWDGLTRVAVFKTDSISRSVLLGESNECQIPWEVLVDSGVLLKVGVYGTSNDSVVLPTVWATLGTILAGTTTGEEAGPPDPDIWEQRLAAKADKVVYDGTKLSLMSGDSPLSEVPISIETIDGLGEAVESIPNAMTADQLRKILNGV